MGICILFNTQSKAQTKEEEKIINSLLDSAKQAALKYEFESAYMFLENIQKIGKQTKLIGTKKIAYTYYYVDSIEGCLFKEIRNNRMKINSNNSFLSGSYYLYVCTHDLISGDKTDEITDTLKLALNCFKKINHPNYYITLNYIGEIKTSELKNDSALVCFLECYNYYKKNNKNLQLLSLLNRIAEIYVFKKDYISALKYYNELEKIINFLNIGHYPSKDLYEGITNCYIALNDSINAYRYFLLYKHEKWPLIKNDSNSIISLHANYVTTRTEINKKEKTLNDLTVNNETLANQKENDRILFIASLSFVAFLVAFSFIIFVFYRRKRESQIRVKEAELKQQISEMEMKALRSQMNPHFIFNCMNSIYKFMQENDNQKAGDYLVRFSKLIRAILENSKFKEVPLTDELEALELYIQMEQLRLKHIFDYKISIAKNVITDNTQIPPLILQPFIENAIWHGLNNKTGQGLLELKIEVEGDYMKYVITDNGTLSKETDDLKEFVKKTSMGKALTQERIDLINLEKESKAGFKETELYDDKNNYSGRKVEIALPFEQIN